jgi:hypothetical protein
VALTLEASNMDDNPKRFARELAEAIAAAAAVDPRVEACRARARAAGFEMKVSLEAVVGFIRRPAGEQAKTRPAARPFEVSASDRRFLRSLRIAVDETKEEV